MSSGPLTRARAASGALDIVDRDGLAALTLDRLAAELGDGPAVRRHLPDHGALLDAVLEALMAEDEGAPAEGEWPERLAAIGAAYRSLLLRHPNAVALVATRPLTTPGALRIVEGCLASLGDGGLEPAEALAALNAVVMWTVGHVLGEVGRPPGDAPPVGEDAALASVQALAPGEFPLLLRAVGGTTWGLPDGQFLFGLEALVRGLEAVLRA